MKPQIIPAILVQSADEALEKIQLIEKTVRWIQIDIMDQTLVKNKSWSDAKEAKRWKIKPWIELHLMVDDPEKYIRAWRSVKNFQRAIWHVEASIDHAQLIDQCRKWKLEVGLAISPETSIASLVPFLRKLNTVLIMGVHPGWSGQKLIPATRKKIAMLKRLAPRLPIEFDGGVTDRNTLTLARAGVTGICMASVLFKQKDPNQFIKKLKKSL
ncbi:hypothetical protein EXS71_02900 [Candidatus Uhrbacteria bacterium]|nr:hypothetical protein [Candidatus Uhrbacteria bacterium]